MVIGWATDMQCSLTDTQGRRYNLPNNPGSPLIQSAVVDPDDPESFMCARDPVLSLQQNGQCSPGTDGVKILTSPGLVDLF